MATKIPQPVLWVLAILCSGVSFVILVLAKGEKSRDSGPEPSAVLSDAYWWYLVGALVFALVSAGVLRYGLEEGLHLLQGKGWGSWWASLLVGAFLTLFASYLPPSRAGRTPLDAVLVLFGVHILALGLVEAADLLLPGSKKHL
jgi:hypothetical protein